VNENLIFITCSGNLMKSEDGGGIWNEIAPLTAGGEIQFLSSNTGFAWEEFNFDYLSKTENGGEMWNEITGVSPVHFLNEQVGFYYNYGLFKTSDGGDNFLGLGFGEWGYLTDIFAPNENNVWGILAGLLNGDPSSRGIIKVSPAEPYSETIAWENNPEIDMLSIHFADENTGYIVGYKNGKGTIWKNGTGTNIMGANEIEEVNEIKVYPNPINFEINIKVEKGNLQDYMVSLTDMTGKQIYSKSFKEKKIKINTSYFQKGIYILSIETKNKKHSQKLMIN
ncbi:MAG: T9SS type A sorting domain-containing protein, partial [Moheibacter sp.]